MKVMNNPNGQYNGFLLERKMAVTSGYKLFKNKLYLFDKFFTKNCKFKKISVLDTFNGKTIKEVVKVL